MNNTAKNVFNSLLSEISERKLGIGDSIPTEKELASRLKTSRANARLAVGRLEERGLVKRNKKRSVLSEPVKESVKCLVLLQNAQVNAGHYGCP